MHVKIIPFGIWHTSSSELTEINLKAVGSLHCAIELKDRCLLAFRLSDYPQYPFEALKGQASGMVLLAATVTAVGRVENVRVKEANVTPGTQGKLLIDAAVSNLSSWHLEPSKGQETIGIAYRYVIDPSVEHNLIDETFKLPSQASPIVLTESDPGAQGVGDGQRYVSGGQLRDRGGQQSRGCGLRIHCGRSGRTNALAVLGQ